MKKREFRIIDYGYFAETIDEMELYRGLSFMCDRGWKIVKIFEPMKYKDSEDYFCRVIFSKKTEKYE